MYRTGKEKTEKGREKKERKARRTLIKTVECREGGGEGERERDATAQVTRQL